MKPLELERRDSQGNRAFWDYVSESRVQWAHSEPMWSRAISSQRFADTHIGHAYAVGAPAFTAHPWFRDTWRVWCRCGASLVVKEKSTADALCDLRRAEL
jgi:hypothetical protein